MSDENKNDVQVVRLGKVYGTLRDSQFPIVFAEVEREGGKVRYQIVTLLPDRTEIYWKGDRSPSLDDFELTRLGHILSERLGAIENPQKQIKGISSHHMGPERTDQFTIDEHWGMINSNRYDAARLEVNIVTFKGFENENGESIPETSKIDIRQWKDGLPMKGFRLLSIDEAIELKKACEAIMKEKGLTYEIKNKLPEVKNAGADKIDDRLGPER